MPRRLLRDRKIVVDEWQYSSEAPRDPAAPLILPFDQWQSERSSLIAAGGRLGVVLLPSHDALLLAPDLPHLSLVAAQFSGPSEGRGYTQGRLLRERLNFSGELRASGYVRRDQLFFLARCGFNSFELSDVDIEGADTAFSTFTAAYQPSNDLGLAVKLGPDIPASA